MILVTQVTIKIFNTKLGKGYHIHLSVLWKEKQKGIWDYGVDDDHHHVKIKEWQLHDTKEKSFGSSSLIVWGNYVMKVIIKINIVNKGISNSLYTDASNNYKLIII
jgi:hypothetical protein